MNKREHYKLNRLMLRFMDKGVIKIENTPSHKNIVESVLKLKESDKKDNDWYNIGFVFIRLLNDYIEIKTINEYNTKYFKISLDEDSLKSYLIYLNKLMQYENRLFIAS